MERRVWISKQSSERQARINEKSYVTVRKVNGFSRYYRCIRQTSRWSCFNHWGLENGRSKDMDVDWRQGLNSKMYRNQRRLKKPKSINLLNQRRWLVDSEKKAKLISLCRTGSPRRWSSLNKYLEFQHIFVILWNCKKSSSCHLLSLSTNTKSIHYRKAQGNNRSYCCWNWRWRKWCRNDPACINRFRNSWKGR